MVQVICSSNISHWFRLIMLHGRSKRWNTWWIDSFLRRRVITVTGSDDCRLWLALTRFVDCVKCDSVGVEWRAGPTVCVIFIYIHLYYIHVIFTSSSSSQDFESCCRAPHTDHQHCCSFPVYWEACSFPDWKHCVCPTSWTSWPNLWNEKKLHQHCCRNQLHSHYKTIIPTQ